jgi:hypothetical protein
LILAAVEPVQPQVSGYDEIVFAKDQPEYIPLPAIRVNRDGAETIVTRWKLTDEEREAVASGADLWLEVMTIGQPLQPIRIAMVCPLESEPT